MRRTEENLINVLEAMRDNPQESDVNVNQADTPSDEVNAVAPITYKTTQLAILQALRDLNTQLQKPLATITTEKIICVTFSGVMAAVTIRLTSVIKRRKGTRTTLHLKTKWVVALNELHRILKKNKLPDRSVFRCREVLDNSVNVLKNGNAFV